jgi:RimJ/RimL family protein N-acetyltransferase
VLQWKGLRVIRGDRVYLRAVEREDLARCHRWINDESLTATLAQRYPVSLAQESDWIERAARGQDPSKLPLAICLAKDDRHIGNCGLEAIDRDNRTATLGIFIGEADCRGKGLGEDAVRALCRYAFDELDLRKIRLDVSVLNPGAEKTYVRVGFRREGILREEAFRGGKPVDMIRMGLLKGELRAGTSPAPTLRRGGPRGRPREARRS